MSCCGYIGVEIISVFVGEEAFTCIMFCKGVGVRCSHVAFTHVADMDYKSIENC